MHEKVGITQNPYERVILEYIGTPSKRAQFTDGKQGHYRRGDAKKVLDTFPVPASSELLEHLLCELQRTDEQWTIKKQQATLTMIGCLPFYKLVGGKLSELYTCAIDRIKKDTPLDASIGLLAAGEILAPHLSPIEKEAVRQAWKENGETWRDETAWREIRSDVTQIFPTLETYEISQMARTKKSHEKAKRKAQIQTLRSQGKSNKQIATILGISPQTVGNYLRKINA